MAPATPALLFSLTFPFHVLLWVHVIAHCPLLNAWCSQGFNLDPLLFQSYMSSWTLSSTLMAPVLVRFWTLLPPHVSEPPVMACSTCPRRRSSSVSKSTPHLCIFSQWWHHVPTPITLETRDPPLDSFCPFLLHPVSHQVLWTWLPK